MNRFAFFYSSRKRLRAMVLFSFIGLIVSCNSMAKKNKQQVRVDKPKPNILFLLADDLSPNCISALGNPKIKTPNIDRLVKTGTSFSRASCSYPICVVSRAEILSGFPAWNSDISKGLTTEINGKDYNTWPQNLKEAGYRTLHVGKWHVESKRKSSPFTRGYTEVAGYFMQGAANLWDNDQKDWKGFPISGYAGWVFQSEDGKSIYPEKGIGLTADINHKFADSTISLIGQQKGKPWFCQVNFTAPHDPLIMPPEMEGMYRADDMEIPPNFKEQHPFDYGNLFGRDEALLDWPRTPESLKDLLRVYYSVVEDLDAQCGKIIQFLAKTDQLDNTIIVFSSDHGMSLGSHGIIGKQNQYESTINTPLIIAGPNILSGKISKAQVYLRDLYPTTCELAGVSLNDALVKNSFASVLTKSNPSHRDTIYGYFRDSQRMLRLKNDWKLIRYPVVDKWQLFNLKDDPFEQMNLAESSVPENRQMFTALKEALSGWQVRSGDPLVERNGKIQQ